MNVFVLCTGRCGSMTLSRACGHISNYTSAHESRCKALGEARLGYPENHIEIDNRLTWFLGRLDEKYGDEAIYVHLKRDRESVARSFVKRYDRGIMGAYKDCIMLGMKVAKKDPLDVCRDFCYTVDSNIEFFLKDKTKKMEFNLESYETDFPAFWSLVGAEGDYESALAEFQVKHNALK